MAINVNKGQGVYLKIESGTTVDVVEGGSLIVYAGGHKVAAFAQSTWRDATIEGDASAVKPGSK